jgi:hypothetical protein
MDDKLATLARRRDRFFAAAKYSLLLCAIAWLASMAFYDTAADPAIDYPKILLPAQLDYAMMLGGIKDIGIRRIGSGPATLFGVQSFASALLVLGLIALFRARVGRRPWSRTGLVLVLLSVPLWIFAFGGGSPIFTPRFVRPDGFERLVRFVEARQPGSVATLRAGGRLDLPERAAGGKTLYFADASSPPVPARPGSPPLADQGDAEAFRFALAQQAMFAGDKAGLRRLLPIRMETQAADAPARDDVAQRLGRIGRAAGMAPVPPGDAAWVAEGERRWRLAMRLIRANRFLIQASLAAGLIALVFGLVLKRRLRRIERSAAAAFDPVPTANPA